MSPQRLALRTILLGRARSVLAVLLIGASLCVLDLFAGHLGGVRARFEQQAVFGERLGHLAIFRSGTARDGSAQSKSFDRDEAARVLRLVRASALVTHVAPQTNVHGIASTGQRSALFRGLGVGPAGPAAARALPALGGDLAGAPANGVLLSGEQARALGMQAGDTVALSAVSAGAPASTRTAEMVGVFEGDPSSAQAPSLLMPFAMAQEMLAQRRTERFVVFLADPDRLEQGRTALLALLRAGGVNAEVLGWQDQSVAYMQARKVSDLAFDSVAGMVIAVIAATVAFTISMNATERRREIATMRALGMRSSTVYVMFSAEALWLAALGIVLSVVASGVSAWVVNRITLLRTDAAAAGGTPMLVELDPHRMLMAVVTVLSVTLMAALLPAYKAARLPIAEAPPA
ncbi:ABC transporter permease [Massilia glaciei]|nr:FtsX-like permease family protein [Massilia glaciei]